MLPPTKHDFVDVARLHAGIFQGLQDRFLAAFDQRIDQFLELAPRDLHRQVFRSGLIHRDERQVHIGFGQRAQFLLRLFAGFLQTLQRHRIVAKIDPVVSLELVGDVVDQCFVKVVTTQVRVTRGADHLKDATFLFFVAAVGHFQHRDVERTTAEVKDDDLFVRLFVQAVGQGGRGRFVDDPRDLQARRFVRRPWSLAVGRH